MTDQEKKRIQQALVAKMEKKQLSNSETARQIDVSVATISNILNNKWAGMGGVWKKVANWVGDSPQWTIAKTKNIEGIFLLCSHAQRESITKAISFRQGSGKSTGAKYYAHQKKNVFYMEVEPHYTRKVFLQKLCKSMGLLQHGSISELMDQIINRLNDLDKPLIILDEFDQLSDKVLPFFKTFYNKANSGFVLIGGEYFSKRILRGVHAVKQSYCEIYSRLGAEFNELFPVNSEAIAQICKANGIIDKKQMARIAQAAKGDLRRVKNEIGKIRFAQENQVSKAS